ncbi:MAG: MFS transporter, partial [Gemmobacter sp.]|nr:MFS transporter [Gemmobacter sp.]
LLGGVICGLAPSMEILIAGRFVQGFGGGGLIVVAMAVAADVLPVRQRGKAQGMMGAVFGISTVIGPLIGGFIVQHLGWHWIFFANLPIALAALVVLNLALRRTVLTSRPQLDVAGAVVLMALLSLAVLIPASGGTLLPWGSTAMIAMLLALVASVVAFVLIERRAPEPILPPELFRIRAFLVSNGVGFLVGTAMFGAITFIPLYLQVVKGVTPTVSGIYLLPMMAGLIGTSALAGWWMTRTGHYRMLPVYSSAMLTLGMFGLSRMSPETPLGVIVLWMAVTGIGLGPAFSVGVVAIQNAVPRSMLGVGTASANMFRLIGGSIGTAAFGAIFGAGLARNLEGLMPGADSIRSISRATVTSLPPEVQKTVIAGFSAALTPIFLVATGLAAVACLLALMLREEPLPD